MIRLPAIIERHLFFEAAKTWIIVAGGLFFITTGMGFAKFISKAAAGEIPVNMVLLLAFYSAIENGEIVFPISILLALLMALGKLYQDNAMDALMSGGARLTTIYRPFLILALIVATITGFLSLLISPYAEQQIDKLTQETTKSAIQTLNPGTFHSFEDNKAIFYAEGKDRKTNALKNVFIRVIRQSDKGPTQTVITADKAFTDIDPDTDTPMLVLENGWREEGAPGQANYRLVQFKEHGIHLGLEKQDNNPTQVLTTRRLLKDGRPAYIAEFQARVSAPLAIIILGLLCMTIGKVPPRSGRYGRIALGILIYAIYINLIHIATLFIEAGRLPSYIGAWSVHAVMFMIAIGLILRDQGYFVRLRYKRLHKND